MKQQIFDNNNIYNLPNTTHGNRYMLVVMDYFTKNINLYALPDQRAITAAKCLFEDICRHGVPHSLHTDQERQFDSDLIKCLCSSMGVHKTRKSPYHSMSDGMVERANRSLKDQLAKYLYSKGGEWDEHMKQVQFAYNTRVHSTTNFTSFFLVYGRESRLPADLFLSAPTNNRQTPTCAPNEYASSVLNKLCSAFDTAGANIAAAALQQKHYYDRQVRHEAYDPEDLVWVDIPAFSRHKLAPRWTGPFKVLKWLDFEADMGVDYVVLDQLDPRAKPKVVHYNHLKPYRSPVRERELSQKASTCTKYM
uniref:Integrase catalytic domain-containing protein n=1 Tax=Xiphophorus couchianus TaxID=32473 RepID=A0A3B5LP93_9TELE